MREDKFYYCDLLGVDEIPEDVPENWCRCHGCASDGEISPENAICCSDIRQSDTELAENWKNFIGEEYEGCFALHPKIQNLINNREEIDWFMILDGIRKDQLEDADGWDRIRGYHYQDRQKGYRFACHRKISMLVHRRYGAERYIAGPACIDEAIRRAYPSAANPPNQ